MRDWNNIKVWNWTLSNIDRHAQVGDGTTIHAGVHIHEYVKIGKRCQIEAQVFIPNGVTLEDNVFIGPGVIFTNDPKLDTKRSKWKPTPTLVKKGAKIGAGAMIKAGITIGENSIIGMGSVVLKDVPPNEVHVGNPAIFLRFNKNKNGL